MNIVHGSFFVCAPQGRCAMQVIYPPQVRNAMQVIYPPQVRYVAQVK
jgi:hypothetical protein